MYGIILKFINFILLVVLVISCSLAYADYEEEIGLLLILWIVHTMLNIWGNEASEALSFFKAWIRRKRLQEEIAIVDLEKKKKAGSE